MLTVDTAISLKLLSPLPLTAHPAAVYLRSLAKRSRLTMQGSLNAIASLLTNGECDHLTLDWAKLGYQQTSAVQAALLEKHAPATAARMMLSLRSKSEVGSQKSEVFFNNLMVKTFYF
jgi:integrase/recombinase XerD